MSRLRVRDAQRRVADAERFVNVVREPRLVPELPGTPQVRGKLREQIVQAVQVLFEIGRQLKQDGPEDRKSTRLNSSHSQISYAVFCLKKKKSNELYILERHVDEREPEQGP